MFWRTVSRLANCSYSATCDMHITDIGKGHPITDHEGPEGEQMYSSTLSLTSALDVGGQRHAPAALPPRKTRYQLYRRLDGGESRSRQVLKISPPSGFDPRTVEPIASRYTDWAIPAPTIIDKGCQFGKNIFEFIFVSWHMQPSSESSPPVQGCLFFLLAPCSPTTYVTNNKFVH